jgi:hypothetical protein
MTPVGPAINPDGNGAATPEKEAGDRDGNE